jgi:serine protease Do
LADQLNLPATTGVLVDSLVSAGAADDAGIRKGDVIKKIGEIPINTSAQLLEQIGRHRPGDVVNITVQRKGNEEQIKVALENAEGKKEIVRKENIASSQRRTATMLGANFKELSVAERKKYGVTGGVIVTKLGRGKLSEETKVREGFIITKIDNKIIRTVQDVENALQEKGGGVLIEGIYPETGRKEYHALDMG